MGRKCVVTGGAGFIGSNLTKELVARGYEVVVIDDLSSGSRQNLMQTPATLVEASILNRPALRMTMQGADTVFHLAASVGNKRSIDAPLLDSEVNVMGTVQVLEACREAGVRKIVYSSSAGIFGELQQVPIAEDHPIAPNTPYGASKLCAEKMCLAYAKLGYLDAVCLRYFNVYGPGQKFDQYGNVIPIFVFQMLQGEPVTIFGDGEQTRDFIHVQDVVQANLRAAFEYDNSGVFNLGSEQSLTINRLIEVIRSAVGVPVQVRHGDPRPGDARDSLADTRLARQQLGFAPQIDFSEGIAEYVAWARESMRRAA